MKKYPEFKGLVTDTSSEYGVSSRRLIDGKNVRGSHRYQGGFNSVQFKVDYPIKLVGLEFFGPLKRDNADYTIRSMVYKTLEDWSGCNWLFSWFCQSYKIVELLNFNDVEISVSRHGENFTVQLPYSVHILPNLWTDIQFELSGPQCLQNGFHDSDGEDSDEVLLEVLWQGHLSFRSFTT